MTADIERVLAEATPRPWDWTPGEWERNTEGGIDQYSGAIISAFNDGIDCGEYMALRDADAELIVLAVNSYEADQERIRVLTKELASVRKVIDHVDHEEAKKQGTLHKCRACHIDAALSQDKAVPDNREVYPTGDDL